MRVLKRGGRPPGRAAALCKTLRYAARMEQHERRVAVGKHVQRSRRNYAGIKSQRKFAEALDISEGSVANLERGADTVGDPTFEAAEAYLKWPLGAIRHYVETGESRIPDLASETTAEPHWPIEPRNQWEIDTMTRLASESDDFVRGVIRAARGDQRRVGRTG